MVSRSDGTSCASTSGRSASWLLRLDDDLLPSPLPFDSRLFKNDMRDTILGSVEDADDETESCAVGIGARTNESSQSVTGMSVVVIRGFGVSDGLSSSG